MLDRATAYHADDPDSFEADSRPMPQAHDAVGPDAVVPEDERRMSRAMLRGFRGRCPRCGSGPMLKGFLKVRDTCPVCGEAFHHHRADDGPPYLTLLIVGHIIGPAMLWVFTAWEPDPWTFMAIFMVAATALSLWLLPRLKGMIVGVQWAARMHGFGHGDAPDDLRD